MESDTPRSGNECPLLRNASDRSGVVGRHSVRASVPLTPLALPSSS